MPVTSRIGVEDLLLLSGTDREAKAYAFLNAAFRNAKIGSTPVRQTLDCIKPFIVAFLVSIPGKRVDPSALKSYLSQTFGFDIPLYVFDQLFPSLSKEGLLEYNSTARAFIARKQDGKFESVKAEIEFDFDQVEAALSAYVTRTVGDFPTGGRKWGAILIAFLRTSNTSPPIAAAKVKNQLLDAARAEAGLVSGFIRDLYISGSRLFDAVVQIFMGVLIEDFIATIAEAGTIKSSFPLVVFYDTTVLLRLLGCSGRLMRIATEELNVYLQGLGFATHYLSGNETEVANILNAIISASDAGREIEGETAEAISSGEVSISDMRALVNNIPLALSALNVFPADKFESNFEKDKIYQINELGFAGYLLEQATKVRRAYSPENRTNDASYLGTVVRLRKNIKTRDLAEARFIFITSNRLLARCARQYLIREKVLTDQQCPAMLSVSQAATIAWLLKDQKLAPEKAGRDLLSNCFAAVRPDAEWFRLFREGIEKQVGNVDEFIRDGNNSLVIQAARRIARDETFGNSALLREANMAELMRRAKEQSDRLIDEKNRAAEIAISALEEKQRVLKEASAVELQQAKEQAEAAKTLAVQSAAEAARVELRNELNEEKRRRSHSAARRVVYTLKGLIVLICIVASVIVWWRQGEGEVSWSVWSASLVLTLLIILDAMHVFGFHIVGAVFDRIEAALAEKIRRWL